MKPTLDKKLSRRAKLVKWTQLTKSKNSQIQFTKKTKKLKNLFLSLTLTCQQIWLVKIKQLLAAKPPLARDLVLVRLMQVMLVHHSWL